MNVNRSAAVLPAARTERTCRKLAAQVVGEAEDRSTCGTYLASLSGVTYSKKRWTGRPEMPASVVGLKGSWM